MTIPLIAPARSAPVLRVSYDAELLYRPRDVLLATQSGQVPVFSRSNAATALATNAVLYPAPRDFACWEALDLNGDGVADAVALALDQATTNRTIYSQSLGDWTSGVGTPVVGAVTIPMGALTLQLAADDSASLAEAFYVELTWAGTTGSHAFSVYVAKPTTVAAGGSRIYIDAAGNTRFSATITWTGAAPVVSGVTGTYRGMQFIGWRPDTEGTLRAVYRLFFLTATDFVPSATNSLRLEPATVAAQTGQLFVGGFQVEDGLLSTGYVPTTTAPVSRSADLFYIPWQVTPGNPITVFLRFMEVGGAGATGARLLSIGNAGSTGARLAIESSGGCWRATHDSGTAVVTTADVATPSYGADVLLRASLHSNGSIKLGQTIGAGAEQETVTTAANPPAAAWADTRVQLSYSSWAGSSRLLGLAIVRGWNVDLNIGASLLR